MEGKKTIQIVAVVLGIIGLLVCWNLADASQKQQEIKSFSVLINPLEGDHFLTAREIRSMVEARLDTFVGKTHSQVNLMEIEQLVTAMPAVKSAQAYLEIKGNLKVEVALKTVIARVKPSKGKGYYLDKTGGIMPWVNSFTPRVLIANGYLERYLEGLEPSLSTDLREQLFVNHLSVFASVVYQDDFWSKQLAQVYINEKGDAELICLIGDQKIILGSLVDGKEKLEKLKIYYEQVIDKVGWKKYNEINLKFKDQIVCK